MGGTDATQAFRDYDFESSQDWLDYLNRVEIPDASDEVLLKLKAKWFIKNVDDSVTVTELLGSRNTARAQPETKDQTAGASRPTNTYDSRGTHEYNRRPSAGTAPTHLAWRQRLLFALHVVVIVSAAVSLLPLFPRLTNRFYRVFLQANILASIMKVHAAHGGSPFCPLSALKSWAMRAVPTTDFQYLMLSFVFLSQPRTTLLLVPITVLAVYHAVAFADQQFPNVPLWKKHGVPLHRWLARNQQSALVVNAAAEVLLGFLLLVQLLTPARNLLLLYIYWNMLRLRYWSPDSRQYHQHAKPYGREDFSHSKNDLITIAHENEILVHKLTDIGKKPSPDVTATSTSAGAGKCLPCNIASSAVNRRKHADVIAQQNLALYKRLQAVKPSRELNRDTLAKQHKQNEAYAVNCSTTRRIAAEPK